MGTGMVARGEKIPGELHEMTLEELVDKGWIVRLDEDIDQIVGVRSVIQNWKHLSWAEQTYYRAKFGFDEAGVLDIDFLENAPDLRKPGLGLCPQFLGSIVTPSRQLPGSNDRLRSVLSQSKVDVEDYRYDEIGLVHFGPDGSVILTCEHLWALATPRDDERGDIDESNVCYWEISADNWTATAPWWARGPGGEELYEFPVRE